MNVESLVRSISGVVSKESVGGNAGCWNGMPCAGVNFAYDPKTGLIKDYGNNAVGGERAIFCVAVPMMKISLVDRFLNDECLRKRCYRIVRLDRCDDTLEPAKSNLECSVEEYNKKHGFDLSDLR